MEYERTVRVSGDVARALKTTVETLAQHGFRIVSKRETSAELVGPGMSSSKQNPLVAASKIRLTGRSGRLSIEADFGGLRRLFRILGMMILGMAVLFIILFGFIIPMKTPPGLEMLRFAMPLAPLAPWPFLLPLMARYFRRRSARALDVLIENAATLADND